jgi:glycine cleavage system H protein
MALYFSKEHEWISVDGKVGTVGITDYAQHALGDVVYVELPPEGKIVAQGGEAAVVESVKAASDVYAPVTGRVTEANGALTADPSLVNSDPQGAGWFFKVELSVPAELEGLMDQSAYDAFCASL